MRNRGKAWITCGALAFVLLAGSVHANPAQQAIVDAGINLGWAVARTFNFPVGDAIQTPAIEGALANAITAMTTAEGLFAEPYQSNRRQWGTGSSVITMLFQYWPRHANEGSGPARANYLHQAFLNYRQSLSVQWDSVRGYQTGPTCDSYYFEVAYHLARAQISSAMGPAGITSERVELQSMKQAIYNALHTAIDGYAWSSGNLARSDNPGDRRLCCSFGPPMLWDSLRAMQAGSIGPAGYTVFRDTMRANALQATVQRNLRDYCRAGDTNESIHMAQAGRPPPVVEPPRPPVIEPPRPPVAEPPKPPVQVACNTTQKQGGDRPETIDVAVGATRGNVSFHYDVMNIKDRIVVTYAGRVLHDTGCISGKNVVGLWLDGADSRVRVQVQPNCAGQKGTSWNFRLVCPR